MGFPDASDMECEQTKMSRIAPTLKHQITKYTWLYALFYSFQMISHE